MCLIKEFISRASLICVFDQRVHIQSITNLLFYGKVKIELAGISKTKYVVFKIFLLKLVWSHWWFDLKATCWHILWNSIYVVLLGIICSKNGMVVRGGFVRTYLMLKIYSYVYWFSFMFLNKKCELWKTFSTIS